MYSWLKKLAAAAENKTPSSSATGGEVPKMSEPERKIRDRAVGVGKQQVTKMVAERNNTQCRESGCPNEVTQPEEGTCESHTPADAKTYTEAIMRWWP